MIEFKDYDPAHPFAVTAERHIIRDGKITLNYAPLKGSVSIDGFSEDATGTLPAGTFYVYYGEEDNYRTADQVVHFPAGYDGIAVTVTYKGVSTMLRAEHMNEIREFMEHGASELCARIIAEHEQNMMEALAEHCGHIVSALRELSEAITASGGAGGEYGLLKFASDDAVDEVLDEFSPGDIEQTESPSVFAKDEDVQEVLDEYMPLPNNGETNQSETDNAGSGEGETSGDGADLDGETAEAAIGAGTDDSGD